MHTLIGFIQLLLVLTHSRIVPEELLVWKTETAGVTKATGDSGKGMIGEATATRENIHAEALTRDDRDICLPQPWKPCQVNFPADNSKLLWPQTVAGSSKLYLVFCQLKTEG